MPYQAVTLKPGIDVEQTPVLNQAGWTNGVNVRFFEGLPQKIGGWTTMNPLAPLSDLGRGMHSWADNTGIPYIAVGTANSLELFQNGQIYDITPLIKTDDFSPDFSTTISTPTVKVTDTAHGALVGDRVNIVVPVSIGGLVLLGWYTVTAVVDANNYDIAAISNATATVNNAGAVPLFTTVNTQPTVQVTLNNHGLTTASLFTVQVSTTVGGFTLLGVYNVTSVTDANNFVITPGGSASSSTTASENGGNARVQYAIHSGLQSATYVSTGGGYGVGPYGLGPYGGSSTSTALTQLRYWCLNNFGQDLVASYNGGPLYIWEPPLGSPAMELNSSNFPGTVSPPQQVNFSFTSATQEMIVVLGCIDPNTGDFDPNLVRWCDAGDFTDWVPTSTNQAGSFRIPSGSKLIGGISTANFNVIWTDVDMWVMSYLGGELIWGFQKVADAVNLVGPLAAGVFRNLVVWPSPNGFYMYDGAGVRQIPCPVWDIFWFNLNQLQSYKINAQVNSWFSEISWGFPSATGSGEVDTRVTYNIRENVWTWDNVARTTWIDENPYGAPAGTDLSMLIQQHETSNDATGAALPSSVTSGWFSLAETDSLVFIERVVVDAIATGASKQIYFSIQTQDWPSGPVTNYGPYIWTAGATGPQFNIVRARGRLANITIGSTATGVFWRLGRFRWSGAASGRGN